jgi:uncharacterized protein
LELYTIGILSAGGLLAGILAGLLGVGGGVFLVPFLVQLGFAPVQAAATSSLSILVTSLVGSWQNWRMGYLDWKRVGSLGLPTLITAGLGAWLATILPEGLLLVAFGCLLLSNLYLVGLRKQAEAKLKLQGTTEAPQSVPPLVARLLMGSVTGLMAGLFGVGGGVILVPLQMLFLQEPIKVAVQTSLGVIVIASFSSCLGHALNGNIQFSAGLILGLGGLIGVQISTRVLPKLPDRWISLAFRSLLCVLAVYMFWKAARLFLGAYQAL